ncbi:hypothetical protein UFOVP252_6 [uncultured Caudovirales phage]|uniref:Uncharacterized protein n=1 Tax=uncultured Caudovirales phage TaxID=2100421 RepID=A0A6J5LE12_9CAUD|nr:hypothetical protein UFOVP252_6 [uncultured Caudovirales phage]
MHTTLVHEETQDSITISKVNDGSKTAIFVVSGVVHNENDSVFNIVDVSELSGNPTNIRLDSLTFAVESGLRAIVCYRNQPYTIPFEGRGKMDLETVGGLFGHEINLVLKGTGAFFMVLDVSKMGV